MKFTPFPNGDMPHGVKVLLDGPPYGRLELEINHDPADGELVLDANSGEHFRITRNVPCGLAGCNCMSLATWVQL